MSRPSKLAIGPASSLFNVGEVAQTSLQPPAIESALPKDVSAETLENISARCSLRDMQEAVSRHAADEATTRLHRKRWLQWSIEALKEAEPAAKRQRENGQASTSNRNGEGEREGEGEGDAEAEREGDSSAAKTREGPLDEATRHYEALEKNLAEPFCYFRDFDVSTAYCVRLRKDQVSAIGRAVPSKFITTLRHRSESGIPNLRRDGGGQVDEGVPSGQMIDLGDSEDIREGPSESARAIESQQTVSSTEEKEFSSPERNNFEGNDDGVAILGISVFARTLQPFPSRADSYRAAAGIGSFVDQCLYRLKTPSQAAETTAQGDEVEGNNLEGPDAGDRGKTGSNATAGNAQADKRKVSDDEGEDDEGTSRRGREKGNNYLYAPEAELVQELEIRSDQTLLHLRDALYCRLDDMPEVHESEDRYDTMQKLHQTAILGAEALAEVRNEAKLNGGASHIPRFSGKKRKTDSLLLIEGRLYGEKRAAKGEETGGWNQSYASLLSEYVERQKLGRPTHGAIDSGQVMGDVKLSELELCAGKPYWYLHQGSCEHIWAVTSVRALHPRDKPKSQGGLATETWQFPVTTHLAFGWTKRPTVRWSQPGKTRPESYMLDICSMCARRPSDMLVSGGSRVQIRQSRTGSDVGVEAGDKNGSHLVGLPHDVLTCCQVCWSRLLGDTASPDPTASPDHDRIVSEQRDREIKCTHDQSNSSWARAGGNGWTVIPNLD